MKKYLAALVLLLLVATAVAQEDNLLIFPSARAFQFDTCNAVTIPFEVTNVGGFVDAFSFTTDILKDYARFNETVVYLVPGETKRTSVTITPPCGFYGVHNINIIGESQSTTIQFFETVQLDILATDIPVIAEGVDTVTVAYGRLAVDIPVKNIGWRDTTYDLVLEGEPWMSLQERETTIPAGSQAVLTMITAPSALSVAEGNYQATLIARVRATGVEYVKTFTVILKEPSLWNTILDNAWWIIPLLILLFVLFIAALIRFKQYWDDTREEREARREEKRKEKEARLLEKQKLKELREQEKQALRDEKDALREARLQEKAALKAASDKEKAAWRHCKLLEYVTRIFMKELRSEFKFNLKSEGKRPYGRWIGYTLLCILLIAAAVGVWLFWPVIVAAWFAVGAGILAAGALLLLIVLLVRRRRQKAKDELTEKELQQCRTEAIKRLKEMYDLIRWEDVDAFYEKKSWGKRIFWSIIVLLLIALAIFSYLNPDFFGVGLGLWIALVALILALLILFIAWLLRHLRKKSIIEREFGELPANRYTKIYTGWKYGLGELALKLKAKAESVLIRIQRHKENPVFIAPEGVVYQYFTVDHVGIEDKNVDKVMYRFSVKKSWLQRYSVPEDNVFLMRYHNGKWSKVQECKVLQGDEKAMFYEATNNVLSLYAIVGMPKAEAKAAPIVKDEVKEEKSDGKTKYFIIGMLLLAALFLFLLPLALNQPSTQETVPTEDIDAISDEISEITDTVAGIDDPSQDIPTQTWPMNTEHRLNLSEHFIDPDGEQLTFKNSALQHINIVYEGSVAVMTPEQGWSGEEVVIFTAEDSEGASVDSDPVKLQVTETEASGDQLVEEYGGYVLLALVFLVLLLIGSSLFRQSQGEN